MSTMRFLWLALGLAGLGFILIWLGAMHAPPLLWLGLALFVAGMLLAPASRYLGRR